jgi:ribosomal protein S12 methylthiotransferase accessory factor
MPLSEAKKIVDADYRPPVKRGDLASIQSGTIVALIDGVFEQDLAVSPREVEEAVARGVIVFGGSSMGALRAAEVPGVIGVGRVFEWYRNEVITRDDEVALLFDLHTGRARTVPTVSVRFAVERLRSLGTIDPAIGQKLISATLEIPYTERTYPAIMTAAGVASRADSQDLMAMLQTHDIKYADAQAVLEAASRYLQNSGPLTAAVAASYAPSTYSTPGAAEERCLTGDEILVWESGDRVVYDDLYEFLALTGKLETYARRVLERFALQGHREAHKGRITNADAQAVFTAAVRRWGWMSFEEAKVTFADLGLDREHVGEQCAIDALAGALTSQLAREGGEEFRRALRTQLFVNDMALKRETMRLSSLRFFASQYRMHPTREELDEARTVLCKVNRQPRFSTLRRLWAEIGFADQGIQDAFVVQLAGARHSSRRLALAMQGQSPATTIDFLEKRTSLGLRPCPKAAGDSRFCLPLATGEQFAQRLREIIGITRIGMIGELADLGGVQVAQAARPGNGWSSSLGSGKAQTKSGAIIGSIMEETEKWAQEQFKPAEPMITGSFLELRDQGCFLDPATLDLPYDSVYHDKMPLQWHPCVNLLGPQERYYLPVDPLQMSRRKNDIYFTHRGARKHHATNGLGSGFSREEAILHGLCEYVERHAQRLAELFLINPGGIGNHPYRFVDLNTASDRVRDLADRLSRRGATVRVLNITSEIRIPTFVASITRNLQRADGYGAHPDPETAIEMSLLEAAQSIASTVAGGREDLSIRARSLGRHERPRPITADDAWFWSDPDPVTESVNEIEGLSSTDIYADIIWSLERIWAAGVKHVLVVDLAPPGIEPAHVVRVILPGLETNNPFFTGPRARLVLLRDLLPKWR